MEKVWVESGRRTIDVEIEGLMAVKMRLGSAFSQAVELLAACKGRVVISGLGKSGLVGRKIAATFSSTGTPSFFMHPVEGQHGDLGSIREGDVCIAISNSGKTDELNALLPALRGLGVKIIALTGGADSPLASLADLVISTEVPREACPFNLAPTSSTTAMLAVGDALAICLIEAKSFTEKDFKRVHPGGALGQRLSRPIPELMHADFPRAPLDADMTLALRALHGGGLGAVLLLDGQGELQGIITDGDLRRALLNNSFNPSGKAAELMTKSFRCATTEQSAAEVLNLMEQAAITVMPILDRRGRPVGIIHLHDLLGKGQISFTA
ncbi:MAG: KpsF/GutQ family sugar-phosphate isomerase [Deltaproteobacteria bacterium]|jgi:arabinose-5-phosphate isomerase|nr:KpsF/GutQ family sugar-phosphate isomerase [Deltaproteobacteria bacterium]